MRAATVGEVLVELVEKGCVAEVGGGFREHLIKPENGSIEQRNRTAITRRDRASCKSSATAPQSGSMSSSASGCPRCCTNVASYSRAPFLDPFSDLPFSA